VGFTIKDNRKADLVPKNDKLFFYDNRFIGSVFRGGNNAFTRGLAKKPC
jgi:hypothetical protein